MKRLRTLALAAVATLALPVAAAHAADAPSGAKPFIVSPMTDHVEIVVPGAQAAHPSASAHYDFIEVALTAPVAVIPVLDSTDDATFKRVQMSDGGTPRVRIQLHHGATTTAKIAAVTRVVAEPDGLHISFPRKETLPTWVAPAMVVEGPAAPKPPAPAPAPAAPAAAAASAEGPAAPAANAAAAPSDSPAAGATQVAPPPAAQTSASPLLPTSTRPSGPPITSVMFVLGICLAGGLLVLWARKRRPANAPEESIRVIATRSLGGKSRIVLVAAGDREMLLSVSDRGATKLIGRWRRGDAQLGASQAASLRGMGSSAAAAAAALDEDDDAFMLDSPSAQLSSVMAAASAPRAAIDDPPSGPSRGPSPSVAGLLKLRRGDTNVGLAGGTGVQAEEAWMRALARSEGNEA